MKVSIVTISFNQAQYLEEAILSVVNQDYADVEYVVVDPGSTDGSREIIQRFRDRIDKVVLEPDSGPADGLNKGFAVATGEIFGFLNADDYLLPGAIRKMVEAFELKKHHDVISAHAYIVDENGAKLSRFYSRRFSARKYVYGAAMIAQQSTFFRSRVFRQIAGFNVENRIAWDVECWVDMALVGAKFARLNQFLSCFRVYAHSISGSGQMSGERAIEYRKRIFSRVMGRPQQPIDEIRRKIMKIGEYVFHPRIFVERLLRGPTIPRVVRNSALSVTDSGNFGPEYYRIYTVRNQPILAAPDGPRSLRRAVLARYQPSTLKRTTYRFGLNVGMITGIDRLFCRLARAPLQEFGAHQFDFQRWLDHMRRQFNDPELHAGIIWPKQLDRDRVYVHLLDRSQPIAFAKISLRRHDDPRLSREATALSDIGAAHLKSLCVPRLLSEQTWEGHPYLLMEPLPLAAQPIANNVDIYPYESIREYSGPIGHIEENQVPALSWWDRYRQRIDERYSEFDEEMNSLMKLGIDVCRAHGDLGPHNVFADGQKLWFCDWEESVSDAPAHTDEISFEMAVNMSAVRSDPIRGTALFKKRHLTGTDGRARLGIMMALAFRHGAEIDDASLIIEHWNKTK